MNLRDALLEIRDEQGALTPQGVVDAARPKTHPLHNRFEWDNRVAGESYRRVQAQELIRTVRVSYKPADEDTPERSVRAFHAIRTEASNNGGYAYDPVEEIIDDPLRRQMLLRDMEREWQALKRRYMEFTEFVDMVRRDVTEAA